MATKPNRTLEDLQRDLAKQGETIRIAFRSATEKMIALSDGFNKLKLSEKSSTGKTK